MRQCVTTQSTTVDVFVRKCGTANTVHIDMGVVLSTKYTLACVGGAVYITGFLSENNIFKKKPFYFKLALN